MPESLAPSIQFVSAESAERIAAEPGVLALLRFGGCRGAGGAGSPWLDTGLVSLGDAPAPVQCWRVNAPVRHVQTGRFAAHVAPGLALLACALPDAGDPAGAAETLYGELVPAAEALGCPHLLRVWQYLPRINEPLGDEDRYKAYCAGRRRALSRLERHREASLPAACLLGDDSDSILLYALAADRPGIQVENPRQVSAFNYPPRYGRASPSFSRALAVQWPGDRRQLYISGTASVVGHETRHATAAEQVHETLANLEALLEAGARAGGPGTDGLPAIDPLKIYIRHERDYPTVREILETRLGSGHPALYIRADVCRDDLLVEIEGLADNSGAR